MASAHYDDVVLLLHGIILAGETIG
jgi:hypothetical protein